MGYPPFQVILNDIYSHLIPDFLPIIDDLGDTLIAEVAEVNNEWQVIAKYVWGSLEPLMMRRYNPQTELWYNYYHVQDGLGHAAEWNSTATESSQLDTDCIACLGKLRSIDPESPLGDGA